MPKREFLHLAGKYDPKKHFVGGWLWSQKIDGIRCFWDGGVSRGMYCEDVPFANTTKHARFTEKRQATGLWTRYGQPISAPNWWLDTLPLISLDGELSMGINTWQETSSAIKGHVGDDRWKDVKYQIFDSPPLYVVFADGTINNANFKKTFLGIGGWLGDKNIGIDNCFMSVIAQLRGINLGKYATLLDQTELPMGFTAAENAVNEAMDQVCSAGAEGLILRNPISYWVAARSNMMLKVKQSHDMEGTVIGYRFGAETDIDRSISGNSTNKLLGKMGSLRLRLPSGIEFELSGFTEEERTLDPASTEIAIRNPGTVAPDWLEMGRFPKGSQVTFKYRELSDTGVPKEARYLRPKTDL